VIWYIENYRRSQREREAIEALVSSVDWFVPNRWSVDELARLTLDGDIVVGDRTFPVSLRYPNHFPHSPPSVVPRGDSRRWSSHQYGPGGELCLEYGSDNWHPDITGADMIRSAYRLLQGERMPQGEREPVASRHKTTVGQDLRGVRARFMATDRLQEVLSHLPESVVVPAVVVSIFHEGTVATIIKSMEMPDETKWEETGLPATLSFEGYKRPASVFRVSENIAAPYAESLKEFRASLLALGTALPSASQFALLVQKNHIHVYFLDEDDDTVSPVAVILPQPEAVRLDEGHRQLADRKVGIVGCGSIGSKVAAMLARSGVGNFLLVDDDIVFPENFVRNDLDWREFAMHKVDSVARKIQLVNPAAICVKRRQRLGGQEASGGIETLIENLAGCDLIFDATADTSVFNYLCAVVAIGKKPLMWAEIFGGGFGGLIARHRPTREPAPALMRAAIDSWCAEKGKPFERPINDYGGGPGAPLIADDADVTVIAAHATRMAIDILISRDPSAFSYSVYLIGLGKGWIFENPFETYPIDVGTPEPSDSEAEINPTEAAAELIRLLRLFAAPENATTVNNPDSETSSS
jgi:molybdopterin/thiamine biosynthesis adenylyltransferase/ubiquitin-protein ligase